MQRLVGGGAVDYKGGCVIYKGGASLQGMLYKGGCVVYKGGASLHRMLYEGGCVIYKGGCVIDKGCFTVFQKRWGARACLPRETTRKRSCAMRDGGRQRAGGWRTHTLHTTNTVTPCSLLSSAAQPQSSAACAIAPNIQCKSQAIWLGLQL